MTHYKSKNIATWLALLFGAWGLHRFYLHGVRDIWGWLWCLPSALGAYGFRRAWVLGQDDHLAWLLLPVLGLSLVAAALAALIYGLMSDEKWQTQFNPGQPIVASHWSVIFGVVCALMGGATVLVSVIAFTGQRFFEYQAGI
jgi:TM2 domain-containing membrane protein YozV